MNLKNRLSRLEAKHPKDRNIVYVHAPLDWTDDTCLRRTEELLGNHFGGEDFKLDVGRACNINEFKIIFAMTSIQLAQLMERIGKEGRRITDERPNQSPQGTE